MTRLPCLIAIQELQHSQSNVEDQIKSLITLKNDIVGHGLRKELAVKNGVLVQLERILSATDKLIGKKAAQHTNGSAQWDYHSTQTAWTDDDEVRLHTTLVLGILARGGPAFVSPILASNILPTLSTLLSPKEVHPKLIAATLKTLLDIASSWALTEPSNHNQSGLATALFEGQAAAHLLAILRQDMLLSGATVCQQISMATKIIATTCIDRRSRNTLVKEGYLDALAHHISAYAMHDFQPAAVTESKASSLLPKVMENILNATSAIIQDSNYRTYRLVLSRPFRRTFSERDCYSEGQNQTSCVADIVDELLPKVPSVVPKLVTFGSQSFGNPAFGGARSFTDSMAKDAATIQPFCSWLIHLARCQASARPRLAVLRLLAMVNASSTVEATNLGRDAVAKVKNRERQFALLAVPLAVQLVQDSMAEFSEKTPTNEDGLELREQASSVLATLIEPSQELQKAAAEAGAIKHITQILRRSFDPITLARPMWSSQADAKDGTQLDTPSARLGNEGVPKEVVHIMKVRAGALYAIAAIAAREDSHKKTIIEQGITNQLIESLVPLSTQTLASLPTSKTLREGNTVNVLIAACQAARALSRSVSLLRTSLIDAGLAKPILTLIQHPNTDLQVAATNVACNLVLEFSPMRQDFFDAGAIPILCEHARQSNHELRVASLWTLKHTILHAPRARKTEILDELGSGFLVQAMSGEQRTANVALGMSTPNAAGEQVDLLNAPNSPAMDIDDEFVDESTVGEGQDDGEVVHGGSAVPFQSSSMRSTLRTDKQALTNLRNMKEREQNVQFQARQQDYMIQEQALDIVRNVIVGDESAGMIDHLNASIGSQRIFEIVEAKLVGGHPRGLAPIPAPVVASTIYIINHFAAASAKYKQTLIAQKQILRAWVPHFNHQSREVRLMCVWTVINLTWVENQADREDAHKRAQELRAVGIDEKVRGLVGDPDLDVRERVKTALRQLEELESTRPR